MNLRKCEIRKSVTNMTAHDISHISCHISIINNLSIHIYFMQLLMVHTIILLTIRQYWISSMRLDKAIISTLCGVKSGCIISNKDFYDCWLNLKGTIDILYKSPISCNLPFWQPICNADYIATNWLKGLLTLKGHSLFMEFRLPFWMT